MKKTVHLILLLVLSQWLQGQCAPIFSPFYNQAPRLKNASLNMDNRCAYDLPTFYNLRSFPIQQTIYTIWDGTSWDTLSPLSNLKSFWGVRLQRWKGRILLTGWIKQFNDSVAPLGKVYTILEHKNDTWRPFPIGIWDSASARSVEIMANDNGLYLSASNGLFNHSQIFKYDSTDHSLKEICKYKMPYTGKKLTATKNRLLVANISEIDSQPTSGFGYIDSSGVHSVVNPNFHSNLIYGIDVSTDQIYAVEQGANPDVIIFSDTGVQRYSTILKEAINNPYIEVLNGQIVGATHGSGKRDYHILCQGETHWKTISQFVEGPLVTNLGMFSLHKGVVYSLSQGTLIRGKIFVDSDSNCSFSKSKDLSLAYHEVMATGSGLISTALSDKEGNFELITGYGVYDVHTPDSILRCGPIKVNTLDSNGQSVVSIAAEARPSINVSSQLNTRYSARWSGFDNYRVILRNLRAPLDTLFYEFQIDPKVKIIHMDSSAVRQQNNKCFGYITNLGHYEKRVLNFRVEIDTAKTDRDTILCHNIYAYSSKIETDSTDNHDRKYQRVVYSYDPNAVEVDKEEVPYAQASVLTYRIDFQNEGSADAFDVRVENAMPHVDWTGFKILDASHPYQFVYENGVGVYRFKDIFLKPKKENEDSSKGFVTYQITVPNNLDYETQMDNHADIFFDLNPPVRTNTAITRVESEPVSAKKISTKHSALRFYPNPSTEVLHISNSKGPCVLHVFSAMGKLVYQIPIMASGVTDASTASWQSGVYYIKSPYGTFKIVKL